MFHKQPSLDDVSSDARSDNSKQNSKEEDIDAEDPENFDLEQTDEQFGLAGNYEKLNVNLRPNHNNLQNIDMKCSSSNLAVHNQNMGNNPPGINNLR